MRPNVGVEADYRTSVDFTSARKHARLIDKGQALMRSVAHVSDPGRVSRLGKVGERADPHLPGTRGYKNNSSSQKN
jgi:hypothetical protein